MAKAGKKTSFVCQECGNDSPKWEGRCSYCGKWNTLAEVIVEGNRKSSEGWLEYSMDDPQEISKISLDESSRWVLSMRELNRVLGGGVVPGALFLVAGDPGIGKSTLLLQLAADAIEKTGNVLYISGEESPSQVRIRADRLGIRGERLYFLAATDVDHILENLEAYAPTLAVIDSIQTTVDSSVSASGGSIAQIRECTRRLMHWAKSRRTSIFLSGHVTKGGEVAGPRILEHMVDVVLYMEGEPISSLRLLRSVKNRFGSTNEVGIFEMKEQGLIEVKDPSRAFISEHREGVVGSAIIPTIEGSRPLIVEIQALTSPSLTSPSRRIANGVDFHRLLLVGAVLSQRTNMPLGNQDIVISVAGGLKVMEPAADLAIAMAIASSLRNMPIDPWLGIVGEVGLSGEIRSVPNLERRVREIARLGFKRCLVPDSLAHSAFTVPGIELMRVKYLADCINRVLSRRSKSELGTMSRSSQTRASIATTPGHPLEV